MAHTSKTAFLQALTEYGLTGLQPQFDAKGWCTFADFAFSTSDPKGQDAKMFKEEVVDVLLGTENPRTELVPKLRRLYAQAYIYTSQAMAAEADPKDINEKVHMHPADRASRTQRLRDRITGWSVSGQNMPGQALTDKFATMLAKGIVKYVPWDACVSREQEMLEEPAIKGLRITTDGLLLQDVATDITTKLSGEFMWDFALRRRACAGDIAGCISFEAQHAWQETLKRHFLATPPPGYQRVSWTQLRNADQALWHEVASNCEDGLGAVGETTVTRFEQAWKNNVTNPVVLACLQFLPAGKTVDLQANPESRANSELSSLKRRLEAAENQIKKAKQQGGNRNSSGSKGGGKGKKRADIRPAPRDLGGYPSKTPPPENAPICFPFNRASGCPLARPGESCSKGKHVCLKCHGNHPLCECRQRGE